MNRAWHHHFGRGIVGTPSDLGILGERPTHPELLDWLADEFVAGGWRLKRMQRLIMTSTAYRQSSTVLPAAKRLDPENRLWSRMPLRRMEAEAVRDTILVASGRLDATPYGPADRVEAHDDGLVTEPPTDQGKRENPVTLRSKRGPARRRGKRQRRGARGARRKRSGRRARHQHCEPALRPARVLCSAWVCVVGAYASVTSSGIPCLAVQP